MSSVYTINYNLYVEREGKEELVESTTTENPLVFCSELGLLLPRFEEEIKKHGTGEEFDFRLKSEEAYGDRDEELKRSLERSLFNNEDGKLDEKLFFVGNVIPLMDSMGNRFNATILDITTDEVVVDMNHPLAGKELHFKGNVIDSHEASSKEIEEFTPHSCGCGCGHDHDCGEGCGDNCGCAHEHGDSCGCGGCN